MMLSSPYIISDYDSFIGVFCILSHKLCFAVFNFKLYYTLCELCLHTTVSNLPPVVDNIDGVAYGRPQYTGYMGFAHLAAGLCCGLSSLAAGITIGIVGDAGVRAVGQQERLFVTLILQMIFSEAIALYGLIISIVMSNVDVSSDVCGKWTQS